MGQCEFVGTRKRKCEAKSIVMATCNKCDQYVQFNDNPIDYKNVECTVCLSSNDNEQWFCNYCKRTFLFDKKEDISCKCGATDWNYFIQ